MNIIGIRLKTTIQISKSPNNKNKHHKWMNKSTLPALPALERVSVFPQDPLQVPLGAGCFKGRGARPCAAVPGPGACSVLHGSGAVRLSAPLLLPPAGAPSGTLLHAEAGSGRVKAHKTEMWGFNAEQCRALESDAAMREWGKQVELYSILSHCDTREGYSDSYTAELSLLLSLSLWRYCVFILEIPGWSLPLKPGILPLQPATGNQ